MEKIEMCDESKGRLQEVTDSVNRLRTKFGDNSFLSKQAIAMNLIDDDGNLQIKHRNPTINRNGHVPNVWPKDELKNYYEAILNPMSSESVKCALCGERLNGVISEDGSHIELQHVSYDKTHNKVFSDERCAAREIIDQGSVKLEIDVPTGELIVANFFSGEGVELPQGERYTKYSLNDFMGRYRTMKYHEKQNIGYAQMSNMCMTVYQNGNDITFGNDYEYELDENENFEHEYLKGEFKVGWMSIDVWRWMCVDAGRERSLPNRTVFRNQFT
jgi:hypothetical protein